MKIILASIITLLSCNLYSQNWDKVNGMNPFVHSLFIPSTDPNTIIAASDSIPMELSSQEPFKYFELLYGTGIQTSKDGGRSFSESDILDSVFVTSIVESPESNNFWIMSYLEKGRMKIAFSTNQGQRWDKGISNCDRAPKILNFAVYQNRILGGAVDANNGLFYSSDNFVTCGQNDTLSVSLRDIRVYDDKIYLASDDRGNEGVYVSSDGGSSWSKYQSGLKGLRIHTVCPSEIYPNVILCGADQVDPLTKEVSGKGIHLSYNNGANWQLQGASEYPVYKIVSHPSNPLFMAAACGEGGVYISSNGGVSWTETNAGLPEGADVRYVNIPDYEKVDGGYLVFASVYGDGLYRSKGINPTLVSIEEGPSNTVSIFPNPAIDKTEIYFTIEKSQEVNLSLIDIQGRSIINQSKFVNEGENYLSLDLSNIDSGVYLINIKHLNGVITEKLVIRN